MNNNMLCVMKEKKIYLKYLKKKFYLIYLCKN